MAVAAAQLRMPSKPDVCYICRQEGHWAADCPRRTRQLGRPGDPKGTAPKIASPAAPHDICFQCGLTGHWLRDCPSKYRGSRCFKCGMQAHWCVWVVSIGGGGLVVGDAELTGASVQSDWIRCGLPTPGCLQCDDAMLLHVTPLPISSC